MSKKISDIYNLIQELSWYFGSHGFSGECCGDLSLVEYMALKKVHESGTISIQELGNSLNVTKGGASKIIDRLENKKYVGRKNSLIDGRVCCVMVTSKGIKVIKAITERYSIYIQNMLKELDPDSVDGIQAALEILVGSVKKQGYI